MLRALGGSSSRQLPWSADHYLATGITIPPGGYDTLRSFDAIFVGALGDPRVPDNRHARDILLGTRFELDLYVNYRPVRLLDDRLCPLKNRTRRDVNFVVFRENTEGLYVGAGGRMARTPTRRSRSRRRSTRTRASTASCGTRSSSRRRSGLHAGLHGGQEQRDDARPRVLAARVQGVAPQYPAIEATHLYIDALAMLLVQSPEQFEVIVTNNLFGDIITDIGGALQGGLGMAASGNIHPGRTSMFEPVHGSAPPLAGKNVANPIGAILSAALMLETLDAPTTRGGSSAR